MRIISASRRTDIPAFYSEWFMNRIRAGFVRWVNPFSKAIYQVSLRPEDVMALVLWSKNYLPLAPFLDDLDTRGYRMVFHFTITGLPQTFEPRVPEAGELTACAHTLAGRYGADAVLWRYDPVLISSATDRNYHLRRFGELCAALEGATKRCYFSFMVPYRKVLRNAVALRKETSIVLFDPPTDQRIELANDLADVSARHGIEMFSCCGDYLLGPKVKKAHCTDAELLYRLYPDKIGKLSDLPTRNGCGCCECTDIGAYDTCPHGCVYCYANTNPRTALRSHKTHTPYADILGGGPLQLDSRAVGDQDHLTLDL